MSDVSPTVAPVPEQALVSVGDITVSEHWLVTPNGNTPLRGTQIFLTDLSRSSTSTPTWAIVLAVIGAFFSFLGLLFLLVRETRTVGVVQITVSNGSLVHMTQVNVDSVQAIAELHGRVGFVRQLIAAA